MLDLKIASLDIIIIYFSQRIQISRKSLVRALPCDLRSMEVQLTAKNLLLWILQAKHLSCVERANMHAHYKVQKWEFNMNEAKISKIIN